MTKFIFDLDGTITRSETLPLIASRFNIRDEIAVMTRETINGNIPFVESFIKRVHILGNLPVDEISYLLAEANLYPRVIDFIEKNKEDCVIATGNLMCWVDKLLNRIGCRCHASECTVEDNKVKKLTHILQKENIVREYRNTGEKVVFIGEGNNDSEAMRLADVSIASGLTHYPAKSVLSVADYLIFDEGALCRQLDRLF
ncbi:MAG: HAD-IB family phosphatase [Methanomassiliicoccaceae archaeon]|nr:HAD-IB family phosphatase [Methanomassiliicoccaceae archaeon]